MGVLTTIMELGERGIIRRVGGSREVGWLAGWLAGREGKEGEGRGREEESWGGEMLRGDVEGWIVARLWGE